MVIFDESERLKFMKEVELPNLEKITKLFKEIRGLSNIKDPFGDRTYLLLKDELETFEGIIKTALEGKVVEIYNLEQDVKDKKGC